MKNKFLIIFFSSIIVSCAKKEVIPEKIVTNNIADYKIELITTLTGHERYVFYTDFSKDLKYLATGSADQTVRIWDCQTWKVLKVIDEKSYEIWGVPLMFSPDNRILAIGSFDNLKILSVENNFIELGIAFAHKRGIQSLFISSDSKYVLTAGADGIIKVWKLPGLEEYSSIKANSGEVWSVCISPDDKYAISGGQDGSLKVWTFPNLELVKNINYHKLPLEYVRFSNNGKMILGASADSTISVWKFGSYSSPYKILKGHTGSVLVALFSFNDNYVISGGDDHTVYFFDLQSGEIVNQIKDHSGDIMTLSISPDGKYLATGSRDRTVKIWSISL